MDALSFKAIASRLDECGPAGTLQAPSWQMLIDAYGDMSPEWGEARTGADLERLPREVRLRVVLLDDARGTVLRWMVDGSPEAARALGGYVHDRLQRGDGGENALCGYLTVPGVSSLDEPN